MSKILVCLLAFGTLTFAQETWNGLRFGMNQAEVRKEYRGTLRKEEDGCLWDRDYRLVGMPAAVSLLFTSGTGLFFIRVQADKPFGDPQLHPPITADGDRETRFANASMVSIRLLNEKQAERYGRPTIEKGTGDLVPGMGQSIADGRLLGCGCE